MTEPGLPAPAPTITYDTASYWAAAAAGSMLLTRCTLCANVVWYPRFFCPGCGATTEAFAASGRGTIYSYTVIHRGEGPYAQAGPYLLAYVELEEGPRVLTNIVDVAPEDVGIGDRVTVVFNPASPDSALIRFRPENG
jgi:uncharacterized OB-fold protein